MRPYDDVLEALAIIYLTFYDFEGSGLVCSATLQV
jgi:hypothetical protein